jgi:tetratricopeptide (TPR) repeat protein
MAAEKPEAHQGTCFVVMGFGKKTDFETGRTLDLDKTYKNIIKPAVTAAGLQCIRADEIKHSGPIDVPMYEQLLNADVVVADLSTSNKNAFYELGVRHALRPYTTIIICEDGIKTFPFDVNHVRIRQYHHMGEGIDFDEVERFRKELTGAIAETFNKNPRPKDSPVYTFLNALNPPALAEAMQGVAEAVAKSAPDVGEGEEAADARIYSELMQDVDEAQRAGDFETAKNLLKLIRKRMQPKDANVPEHPYIIQRLALVTYKGEHATSGKEIAALNEARQLLAGLHPATSNDTETLGLWGAVHKRLWEKTQDVTHLDEAVRGYERGFYLRNDYYNGINLAFLHNVRAAHAALLATPSADPAEAAIRRAEAVADFVQAQRVRREVVLICDQWLAAHPDPAETTASTVAKNEYLKNKYWVVATQAEAYLGVGEQAKAAQAYEEAFKLKPEPWMVKSTQEQREKLQALLADSPLVHIKTP